MLIVLRALSNEVVPYKNDQPAGNYSSAVTPELEWTDEYRPSLKTVLPDLRILSTKENSSAAYTSISSGV
jgi:hypothetical protein